MSDQPTCSTCKFWVKNRIGNDGECRRYPPRPHFVGVQQTGPMQQATFTSSFPVIRADLGCGEHRAKVVVN